MPCYDGDDRSNLRCSFKPSTSTFDCTLSDVAFTLTLPAKRCPSCDLVVFEGDVPQRALLLAGLALADLGLPSPEAVRDLRYGLGLKAAELARFFDVTASTVSHWENGRTALPRAVWVALATLAAENLGRPATPKAWLLAALAPKAAPKQLEIDATHLTPTEREG